LFECNPVGISVGLWVQVEANTTMLSPLCPCSNELLVIHRALYEDLLQVPSLSETAQVDKLFEILERTFLAFGHYSSYLAGNRQQNIQVSVAIETSPTIHLSHV